MSHQLLIHHQHIPQDVTGTEFLLYRRKVNKKVDSSKALLESHEIFVNEVKTYSSYAGISHDEEIRVFLQFNTAEDLALAKLLLGNEIVDQTY